VKTRAHEGELSAAPRVLAALPLAGCTITGDALYCQRALCRQIQQAHGQYLFFVKANQPQLLEAVQLVFAQPPPGEVLGTARQQERRRGRAEDRQVWASPALGDYLDWPGLVQVGKVERTWTEAGVTKTDTRYFITSSAAAPVELLALVRGHWGIENRLHYVRDVTFREDQSRVRTGAAPEVLAAVRNVVIALLRYTNHANLAAALRELAWRPAPSVLAYLGLALHNN
jgi:predicted transposase YbfD/YdcC